MDTPLVNGEAYPTLAVEPKPYRFRILSVGNDRTLNLSWFYACDQTNTNYTKTASAVCPIPSATTSGIGGLTEVAMVPAAPTAGFPSWWPANGRDGGVPDPLASGPSWIQIANEGGVLPAPVVIPPAPINYEYNRRSVTVTNTSSHSLNLMPAERADVIVDFTPYHGKTLILYNDAPAPYPAFDSRYDYYTGDPDQTGMGGALTTLAGFGPNTRTVMQVTVGSTVATPSNITDTVNLVKNLNAVLPAVFYYTQPVPVLPASVYNNVYKGTFANILPKLADIQETFTPIGGTTPVTLPNRNKTIQELFELDFGRMNATLGTELALTNFNTQTTIPLNYVDPFTEDFYDSAPVAAQPVGSLGDGNQIWEVIHNGVDTHAIHFHLYNVQILDRVGWDGTVRYPDANEYGWKDTVRMNPLEIDFVAMRPMSQSLPFPVPDSTRLLDVTMPAGTTADPNMSAFGPQNTAVAATNGVHSLGWEYVWHCHILGHEENDMMRDQTFQVLPQAPVMGTVNGSLAGNTVTFTDKSLSETGFTLERADDAVFSVNKTDFTLPAQPGYNSLVTYLDATTASTPSKTFYYQVRSFKPDADFYAPGANLVSAWSGTGHTTLVPTASVNPTSLAFGNQRTTTTSAAQTITLTNTGLATLTIGGISLTGTDASYFVLNPASTCVAPLASNASCTISVKFAPVSIGARSANVTITSNDPASPLNVPLTGNGQAAVIVTASSTIVAQGAPIPVITATATGLVAPDTLANLTGMTCSTTYTTAKAVGTTWPSTCSGNTNANYAVTYVAGKVIVGTPPAITNPANGATLAGASQAFTWTGSIPASTYGILVGTQGVGSANVFFANGVSSPYTVNGLPTAGQTVYVRLNYTIAGVTLSVDYTYKAGGAITPPLITIPTNGGTLAGASQAFTWTASIPAASSYGILVGTTGAGSANVKSASGISSPYAVTGLPTAGQTINVRVNYTIAGVTSFVDYTYKAFGAVTAPVVSATGAVAGVLPAGTTASFTWTASNPAASTYGILVGTTGAGSANLKFGSGVTSPYTVTNLPATHGTTIYVRLNYTVAGVTQYVDYTFKTF